MGRKLFTRPPGEAAGRPFAAAALLASLLFAAALGLRIGSPGLRLHVDDLGTAIAALTASALCARAAIRHRGRMRVFWSLLAAACAAWALGELTWAVYELVLDDPVPVPSWADVGYLGGIPLAVAALLAHPAMSGGRSHSVRSALDGLAVATALLLLSWTLVLGPLWQHTDLSTLGGVVALAYPFGDVVIVFFIVLAVRRMTGERRALWWLLGGLLAIALSDSVYAYLTEVQGYEVGGVLDTGWFAGYLLIALGAVSSRAAPLPALRGFAPPSIVPVVAPFVPILAALGFIAVKVEVVERLDGVTMMTALALVMLVLTRQLLLMRDLDRGAEQGAVAQRLQSALSVSPDPEAALPWLHSPERRAR